MASDFPRVTCFVSKKARVGPRHLDWVPESAFGLLWPQVLHNQKWEVRVLGRLVLEDCVHSGLQMWPQHMQKSHVACTSAGCDPGLCSTQPCLPRSPLQVPCLPLSPPAPPLHPRDSLLSFLSPSFQGLEPLVH